MADIVPLRFPLGLSVKGSTNFCLKKINTGPIKPCDLPKNGENYTVDIYLFMDLGLPRVDGTTELSCPKRTYKLILLNPYYEIIRERRVILESKSREEPWEIMYR